MKKQHLLFLIPIIFILINCKKTYGQIPSSSGSAAKHSEKNFSFLPVPYINYDRTLGFSGGLLPLSMYNINKKDSISPSSISGGFGMYTTNKSWFLMQFNKFYFSEDRYRAVLVGGTGQFYTQFFIDLPAIEDFVGYGTAVNFFKAELQRRIVQHLYFGLNYVHAKLYTQITEFEEVEETVYLDGIGSVLSFDIRDDVYYPHKGFIANLNFTSYPEFMGNEYISNKIILDYNHFFGMRNKCNVIGARFYGGAGIGDLSFNQQFIVGNNDIRGYTQGKYRGDQIVAIQGEYRYNPFKKLGFVGFAGVASVFSAINEVDNGKLLPSIGTGFRYNIFPKNHLNAGMDFAAGIEDWGIYFKIGEAF